MRPPPMRVDPVILEGATVRLEPLSHDHLYDLTVAAAYPEIWTYLDEHQPPDVQRLITDALQEQARGERLPFAIIHGPTDQAIGSISYINIRPTHHGLEIGWAWITPAHWRTGVAYESAQLLIRHAFESLDAIRVAFTADSRHQRAQHTIQALGAHREGTLRAHLILHDGHIRDSISYSITVRDWHVPPSELMD
jgi:N-acetyltransferase